MDALVVQDLDHRYHGDELPRRFAELETGWRTLEALRDRGEVAALGFGVFEEELIEPILDIARDFLLVAMPYTLLDQRLGADAVERCRASGTSLVLGSPYASSVLARGSGGGGPTAYGEVPPGAWPRRFALWRSFAPATASRSDPPCCSDHRARLNGGYRSVTSRKA